MNQSVWIMDIIIPTLTANNTEFQSFLMSLAGPGPKPSLHTGFTTSFLAILVSEVGDKTFFLAMIMALRYSQLVVFLGAYGALTVMTVLSTAFGRIATAWISPLFTNIVVTLLFLYFGIKMLIDAKNFQQTEENEQLKQVEHQLQEMENKFIQRHSKHQKLIPNNPQGAATTVSPTSPSKKKKMALPNSHIFSQAFVMTFLAEWGDRSQIATIALAASFNPFMVTFGALLGHFICTVAAVKIGELISAKVTEKQVLTVGGIVFIISGICTGALATDHYFDEH